VLKVFICDGLSPKLAFHLGIDLEGVWAHPLRISKCSPCRTRMFVLDDLIHEVSRSDNAVDAVRVTGIVLLVRFLPTTSQTLVGFSAGGDDEVIWLNTETVAT
jgi:hypothetical protein